MQIYATNETRAFCAMDDHVEGSVLRSIKTKTGRTHNNKRNNNFMIFQKSRLKLINNLFENRLIN